MKYFFKIKYLNCIITHPTIIWILLRYACTLWESYLLSRKKMLLLSFDLSFMTYVVLLVGSDAFPSASSVLVVGAKP